MATTLVLRLPWGRFHATPWDRNVNEGVVDWPPSPWRLLRALYATWRTRAPHLEEGDVVGALARLTSPPTYVLPPYRSGHTRHYYPDPAHRTGKSGDTDKILDAFVVTERDAELSVTWSVDLSERERAAVAELADALPHIGRADTVCLARLDDAAVSGLVARPVEAGETLAPGAATIRLLAPTEPLDLGHLTVTTTQVRRSKLATPPGTRWVHYVVPAEIAEQQPRPPAQPRRPTAIRWVVADTARPSVHATVTVTQALRAACQSVYGAMFDGASSAQLSGKDTSGRPLEGHVHAHYVALDRPHPGKARGDRRIENLLLWVDDAGGGLGDEVLAAVTTVHLNGLRGRDLRPLRIGLEAVGALEDVAPELVASPPAGRVWHSHTPFVPPRHRKRRDDPLEFLHRELGRELISRGLPAPVRVDAVRGDWLAYRRHRRRLDEARWGTGVRMEFAEPVAGPISLGALSHFGLGLFLPVA